MAPSSYGVICASDSAVLHLGDTYNTLDSDAIKEDTVKLLRAVESSKREDILNWIYPDPHWQSHCRRTPDAGSCDWLLQHPTYQAWDQAGAGQVFWLRGKMGSGKSHLTHAIVENWSSNLFSVYTVTRR